MLCRAFRRASVVPRLAPAKRQMQPALLQVAPWTKPSRPSRPSEPRKPYHKALPSVGRLLYRTRHDLLGYDTRPRPNAQDSHVPGLYRYLAHVMANTRADVLKFGHADQPNCVRPAHVAADPALPFDLSVCIFSNVRPRLLTGRLPHRLPHVAVPGHDAPWYLLPCTGTWSLSLATSRCIASSLLRGSQLARPTSLLDRLAYLFICLSQDPP